MVSRKHEGPIELIGHIPQVVTSLLTRVGVEVGEDCVVEFASERLTQMNPTELRADLVVTVHPLTRASFSVIIEVQRRRDPEKERSWPAYVAQLWRRTGQQVVLIVICFDDATATWAGKVIRLGPGAVVRPSVISPEQFPLIEDPADFDGPIEAAVFGALLHADGPDGETALETLMALLDEVEVEEADRYIRYLDETLSFDAKEILEVLMTAGTYEFQRYSEKRYAKGLSHGEQLGEEKGRAEGRAEGKAEGKAEGEAEALLTVLAARGLDVSESLAETIRGCTDLAVLKAWIERAVTVSRAEDILA